MPWIWQALPPERRSGEATTGDERTADASAVAGQEAGPKRKPYGQTQPEAVLKTDRWDVKGAGFVEVDLVHNAIRPRGSLLTV